MKVTIEKNELVIRIPMTKPTLSPSGKTYSIASSHGNIGTDCACGEKGFTNITVGLNAYVKKVG